VIFYLTLPLFGLCAATRPRTFWFLAVFLALLVAYRLGIHSYEFNLHAFWVGFVVSELLERYPGEMARLKGRAAFLAILLGLAVLPCFTVRSLGLTSLAFASLVFACVAAGNDMEGILTLRGSRLLGIVSYSIYLLHICVVSTLLRLMNRTVPIAGVGSLEFCALVVALMFIVAAVSLLSFRYIEWPWLRRRPAI
jgi:peptidoglycan/LPS O-acetylase OafA/YrhL